MLLYVKNEILRTFSLRTPLAPKSLPTIYLHKTWLASQLLKVLAEATKKYKCITDIASKASLSASFFTSHLSIASSGDTGLQTYEIEEALTALHLCLINLNTSTISGC